jgi:hypothetical protein
MSESIQCLRCHTPMEIGFVIDGSQRGFLQETWTPGTPQPSFWTGVKLKRDELLKVTTHRCPNCGYLESYAASKSFA